MINKGKQMAKQNIGFGLFVILATTMAGCSSTQQLPFMGSQEKPIEEDSSLVVPPTLKMPGEQKTTAANTTRQDDVRADTAQPAGQSGGSKSTTPVISTAANVHDKKNYYVVVGTYPSQQEALDTFVRLSSIGLPNSTMETRTTKSGQQLHMVRLGPFQDQNKIDKVKDSLLSDGLSQFKVVEN